MTRRLIDLPEMIVRDVAELPDRTSPPEAPEMMLVTAPELDRIVSARVAELADDIDAIQMRAIDLVKALSAAAGYLRNASIDLQTGAPKKTALRTIEGGLKLVENALGQYGDAIAAAPAAVNIHNRGGET